MVFGRTKLMKERWYPQVHRGQMSLLLSAFTATKNYTILPISFYDEGMGVPSTIETNPEHADFAPTSGANCFPDSRIDVVFAQITFTMSKKALETDKITALKCYYMIYGMAFLDDYDAFDEKTSTKIEAITEMQTESTDRQAYPLFAGTKLTEKFAGSATFGTTQLGLTTNQIIEGVAFNPQAYFDMHHYQTNGPKLATTTSGLRSIILTRQRPVKTINIKIRRKTKFMNQYNFFGCLVGCPNGDTNEQLPALGDMSSGNHVVVRFTFRYNEWHPEFNFKKA